MMVICSSCKKKFNLDEGSLKYLLFKENKRKIFRCEECERRLRMDAIVVKFCEVIALAVKNEGCLEVFAFLDTSFKKFPNVLISHRFLLLFIIHVRINLGCTQVCMSH